MKLTQYGISLGEVKSALDASNQEAGGSSVELAEAEYMVRASGYLQTLDDFKNIVLKTGDNGVPVYLGDVARVQIGPEMRRGIAELNGEGEVAGGVVILRSGKNAREVISAVKRSWRRCKAACRKGWKWSPPTTAASLSTAPSTTSATSCWKSLSSSP